MQRPTLESPSPVGAPFPSLVIREAAFKFDVLALSATPCFVEARRSYPGHSEVVTQETPTEGAGNGACAEKCYRTRTHDPAEAANR